MPRHKAYRPRRPRCKSRIAVLASLLTRACILLLSILLAFSAILGININGLTSGSPPSIIAILAITLGVIAHTFQLGDDIQDRYNFAQVRGDRLLQGDEVDAFFLNLPSFLVDEQVIIDDSFGLFDVAVCQAP